MAPAAGASGHGRPGLGRWRRIAARRAFSAAWTRQARGTIAVGAKRSAGFQELVPGDKGEDADDGPIVIRSDSGNDESRVRQALLAYRHRSEGRSPKSPGGRGGGGGGDGGHKGDLQARLAARRKAALDAKSAPQSPKSSAAAAAVASSSSSSSSSKGDLAERVAARRKARTLEVEQAQPKPEPEPASTMQEIRAEPSLEETPESKEDEGLDEALHGIEQMIAAEPEPTSSALGPQEAEDDSAAPAEEKASAVMDIKARMETRRKARQEKARGVASVDALAPPPSDEPKKARAGANALRDRVAARRAAKKKDGDDEPGTPSSSSDA